MSLSSFFQSYSSLLNGLPSFSISFDLKPFTVPSILELPLVKGKHGKSLRENYRTGLLVDQPWAQKYIDHYRDYPILTALDCVGFNVVNVPLGFMLNNAISQSSRYYESYKPQLKCFGTVFWKGSVWTHANRSKIIYGLKSKRDSRFLLRNWHCKRNPYGRVKPPSCEYSSYFDQLSKSDLFLVLRGDKPWLYSFFDCLLAGAIPVCIDTFYPDLGLENIGINTNDLLLALGTKTCSLDQIYESIVSLLEDEERVIHMKQVGQNFMRRYILNDHLLEVNGASVYFAGWGDFIAAKLLETARNGYALVDNSFICQTVNEVKHEIQSQKAH